MAGLTIDNEHINKLTHYFIEITYSVQNNFSQTDWDEDFSTIKIPVEENTIRDVFDQEPDQILNLQLPTGPHSHITDQPLSYPTDTRKLTLIKETTDSVIINDKTFNAAPETEIVKIIYVDGEVNEDKGKKYILTGDTHEDFNEEKSIIFQSNHKMKKLEQIYPVLS